MTEHEEFLKDCRERIRENSRNKLLLAATRQFTTESMKARYSYNFSWLGRPIIQYPQDILAMQEILWQVRPDLVIETGIAHGGSLVFYASILELIGKGEVLGIDIDIRLHNRQAIEQHPMHKRISMIQGSSVSTEIVEQVGKFAEEKNTVLVCLDSDHRHAHVLEELRLYSPFVSLGSYLVVFDTIVDDLPDELWPDGRWGQGDNPKTAVLDFLRTHDEFVIEKDINNKLLVSVAPDGYLKRVR